MISEKTTVGKIVRRMKCLKTRFAPRTEFLRKWNKLRRELYETTEYKLFLVEVRTRAGFMCQTDGCRKRGREVHHVIRVYDDPDLCIDPANGKFLCLACHRKQHKKEEPRGAKRAESTSKKQ